MAPCPCRAGKGLQAFVASQAPCAASSKAQASVASASVATMRGLRIAERKECRREHTTHAARRPADGHRQRPAVACAWCMASQRHRRRPRSWRLGMQAADSPSSTDGAAGPPTTKHQAPAAVPRRRACMLVFCLFVVGGGLFALWRTASCGRPQGWIRVRSLSVRPLTTAHQHTHRQRPTTKNNDQRPTNTRWCGRGCTTGAMSHAPCATHAPRWRRYDIYTVNARCMHIKRANGQVPQPWPLAPYMRYMFVARDFRPLYIINSFLCGGCVCVCVWHVLLWVGAFVRACACGKVSPSVGREGGELACVGRG
jgi:hypothetical protein